VKAGGRKEGGGKRRQLGQSVHKEDREGEGVG
jgi:hypothetical protein